MTPISVQLYSLRDASEQNFDAVLEELAAIGYAGVEPFNLFGKTAREFRSQVEALGMKVSSSHTPWANRSPIDEVVEALGELGLTRAIGGFMPDDFKDLDAVCPPETIFRTAVAAVMKPGARSLRAVQA